MLVVLGEDVDPTEVTRGLGMFPDQGWRRGEIPRVLTPDGRVIQYPKSCDWGGWKKFMPESLRGESLEAQLEHWVRELDAKGEVLRTFVTRGWSLTLDCFIHSSDVAVIELRAELLSRLAVAGVDVDLHLYTDND